MFSVLNNLHELRICHKGSYCRIAVPDCYSIGFLGGHALTQGNAWSASTLPLALPMQTPRSLSQGMLEREIWKTSSFRVVWHCGTRPEGDALGRGAHLCGGSGLRDPLPVSQGSGHPDHSLACRVGTKPVRAHPPCINLRQSWWDWFIGGVGVMRHHCWKSFSSWENSVSQ